MKLLLGIVLSIAMLDAKTCHKKQEDTVPACIQAMIAKYQNRPVQNPSASFYEYDYKGQKVYYMKPPCCDQFGKLYDANCNFLCSPDGGITGKGDGKCTDFFSERKNEKLIWNETKQ